MKLLRYLGNVVRRVFSDKDLNLIACGIAAGLGIALMSTALVVLTFQATEHSQLSNVRDVILALIALVAAIALGLATRNFNFSAGPVSISVNDNTEGNNPHENRSHNHPVDDPSCDPDN